jgi:sodium/potassium-transporting ATPase subunit alpha
VTLLSLDELRNSRRPKGVAEPHFKKYTTLYYIADRKEILRFVFIIGSVSVTFASLVVIVWASYVRVAHPGYMGTTQLLITTISVLIAVIPEGLPVSVTLALTVIAKALGNCKVLCKSLSTVETLGAVNVLCSDKTGTLTQNKMFVQTASVLDEEFSTMEAQAAVLKADGPPKDGLDQLQFIAAMCNAAQFDASTIGFPVSQRKINGDATDAAILRFAEELGSVNAFSANWKMVFDLPFNSKNKYMVHCASKLS